MHRLVGHITLPMKRQDFLFEMGQYFEVVIYTDEPSSYAMPVINKLDKQQVGGIGDVLHPGLLLGCATQWLSTAISDG